MIDPVALRAHFERCWPWLEAALKSHPETYTKDDVWAQVESGQSLLWPLPNAVILTSIRTYPTGMKEMWGWLAGGDLDELKAFAPTVERVAKEMGCKYCILSGRRGWLRVFDGYHEGAVFLRKEIQ